ncbi:hypothetical protein ENBRE01_2496 [Enteropsectra breve]|nr:hypothetical protein ENBRE01_2496 [Enteropsectra breve]
MKKIDSSPTLIALLWGTIATWIFGLIFGFLLYLCMRLGPWPKYSTQDIILPIVFCISATLGTTVVVGLISYFIFKQFDKEKIVDILLNTCDETYFRGKMREDLETQRMYMVCCYIHGAIYIAGPIYAILTSLCVSSSRSIQSESQL